MYRVAKCLWLHMLFQLLYIAFIVVKRKKPTHSVEYVVYTARNKTFDNLKVLERGPLRLVKVTFTRHLQDIYGFKCHIS